MSQEFEKGRAASVLAAFAADCLRGLEGGISGYKYAGFAWLQTMRGAKPAHRTQPEWDLTCDDFEASLTGGADDKSILAELEKHFPQCLALLPEAKRAEFVLGLKARLAFIQETEERFGQRRPGNSPRTKSFVRD